MSGIKRIAITGKLRSGKSTVAGYLAREYGLRRVAFGDSLKFYADNIFDYLAEDITRPCPFGGEYVAGKRKPRRLYQQFGQLMREIDPDVWVTHAERAMRMYEGFRDTRGIVIDDLRQPNEYEWAQANGFTVIRVSANEDTRIERAMRAGDDFSLEDLRHNTEQHIDDFEADYDVWNDGDLGEVKRRIDEIMEEID